MTKNAQGQPVHSGGTYRVKKNASISVDTPFNNGQKGITKMVGQSADPDDIAHLMGTDASAKRMGVDPKAFAKFQQGLPREDYVPTGYNDKNREKAMMRKAMQQITQDKKFVGESKDIIDLARRISNVEPKANTNQRQDVINLKKLAGL
jgi:copper oxidase (laccase) domain-containing protein